MRPTSGTGLTKRPSRADFSGGARHGRGDLRVAPVPTVFTGEADVRVVFASPASMADQFRQLCVRRELAIRNFNVDLAFNLTAAIDILLDAYLALLAAVA